MPTTSSTIKPFTQWKRIRFSRFEKCYFCVVVVVESSIYFNDQIFNRTCFRFISQLFKYRFPFFSVHQHSHCTMKIFFLFLIFICRGRKNIFFCSFRNFFHLFHAFLFFWLGLITIVSFFTTSVTQFLFECLNNIYLNFVHSRIHLQMSVAHNKLIRLKCWRDNGYKSINNSFHTILVLFGLLHRFWIFDSFSYFCREKVKTNRRQVVFIPSTLWNSNEIPCDSFFFQLFQLFLGFCSFIELLTAFLLSFKT